METTIDQMVAQLAQLRQLDDPVELGELLDQVVEELRRRPPSPAAVAAAEEMVSLAAAAGGRRLVDELDVPPAAAGDPAWDAVAAFAVRTFVEAADRFDIDPTQQVRIDE